MVAERRQLQRMLETQDRPVLVVSLPRNEVQFAEAAQVGGADAVKVHINVHHHASGTVFGSLQEEQEALEAIVQVGLPVGIVPGAEAAMASPDDMQKLDEMGIDFFDAYVHQMPAAMLQMETQMSRMIALSHRQRQANFSLGPCAAWCDLIEASIIEPDGYGHPLTVADLCDYSAICTAYPDIPVLAPTQRRIRPDELSILTNCGIRGIIIGAVVTGDEPATVEQTTRRFADVLT
ncbi:MAG: hypothetical protein KAW89_09230 [Armatimonadetes bacterium]|nr:hypothetical protein [Armatimonadota bacterium]